VNVAGSDCTRTPARQLATILVQNSKEAEAPIKGKKEV